MNDINQLDNTELREASPLLRTIHGHTAVVLRVQIDGQQVISSSGDAQIKIWDIKTGSCLKTIEGHTKGVSCLEVVGSYIVSGSTDKTVRIFERESGAEITCLTGHSNLVRTVKANFGVKSQSHASFRKEALETAESLNARKTFPAVEVCSERIVSGSYDETVILWKRESGGTWRVEHRIHPVKGFLDSKRQLVHDQAHTPGSDRVFHADLDRRRLICSFQESNIVGWDFANGDKELEVVSEICHNHEP
jgi:F-box and WD-40 domain protein 1/11